MSARTESAWEAWLANRKAVKATRRTDRADLQSARDRTPMTGPNGEDIAHGLKTYNRGCSCDVCRAAKRDYMRKYRARS
jgi:hypothetical protein